MNYHLSEAQQQFYHDNGYLIGLPPVYNADEVRERNANLPHLLRLLEPGEDTKDIREWHETSRWLFDICMNPKVLDLVEGILGPNFYLWASNFFIKEPHTPQVVGWHQDAYYWPMAPHHSVTVWLAFIDVDEENGAMQVVPGSHKAGLLKHNRSTQTNSVLTLELEQGTFREDSSKPLILKAGEVSLHDDRIVHGSPANPSNRPRIGLTMRYSGTEVKNDMALSPNFKTYLCRGVDEYRLNPVGTVPSSQFGRPDFKAVSLEETGTEEERATNTSRM